MKVRQTDVSDADKQSAKVFFDAMFSFWDLSKAKTLDAFARNGQLTVENCVGRVGSLECWELGPEHEEALRKHTDNVKIGCSYTRMGLMSSAGDYDLIVVDTPQGLHRSDLGDVCCEHFDFLKLAARHLSVGGIIVLYCNKAPYNKEESGSQGYDEYAEYSFPDWMERRMEYYDSPTGMVSEDKMIKTYRDVLRREGRAVRRILMVPCFSDVPGKEPYAFRLALEVL